MQIFQYTYLYFQYVKYLTNITLVILYVNNEQIVTLEYILLSIALYEKSIIILTVFPSMGTSNIMIPNMRIGI